MKKLLTAVLIIASFTVSAKPKLIIGIGSRHFSEKSHEMLNENNPAVGVELLDVQAVYVSKNSWGKKSVYLTYTPDYQVNDRLSLSLNIGAATGYKCSNSVTKNNYILTPVNCSEVGIAPVAAVSVDYAPFDKSLAFSVAIAPTVAMFYLTYSFNNLTH